VDWTDTAGNVDWTDTEVNVDWTDTVGDVDWTNTAGDVDWTDTADDVDWTETTRDVNSGGLYWKDVWTGLIQLVMWTVAGCTQRCVDWNDTARDVNSGGLYWTMCGLDWYSTWCEQWRAVLNDVWTGMIQHVTWTVAGCTERCVDWTDTARDVNSGGLYWTMCGLRWYSTWCEQRRTLLNDAWTGLIQHVMWTEAGSTERCVDRTDTARDVNSGGLY